MISVIMAKIPVEQSMSINMARLKADNLLGSEKWAVLRWSYRPTHESSAAALRIHILGESGLMRLVYDGKDKEHFDYQVNIISTPCYYGGQRFWFSCPLMRGGLSCGRRVGVLYKPDGAKYFGCRQCYNLTYQKRNENRHYSFYGLGKFWERQEQAELLERQIKKRTWRGQPTRKQRRLEQLYHLMAATSPR